MFQPARWALMSSMLLAACAGVPGRGAPDRYAQSFDSATSACRQNPALCAQVAGAETVVPQAARRLAETGASVAAVGMALITKQTTFISEEEAQSLLRQWRGDELKGTLRPDVVIHSGNPLQVRAVYDFKFSCADGSRPTPWTRYTEGPHQGFDQKQVYRDALRVEPFRIVPWLGIIK